jgi:hypothetical protein
VMQLMCCEQGMRAMGPWPTQTKGFKYGVPDEKGGRSLEEIGPVQIMAEKYHCLKCNTYMDVVQKEDKK